MEEVEIIDSITVPSAVMSMRADGIVRTEITEDYDLSIEDAHQLMDAYLKLGKGNKFPHLFVFHGMSLADKPVMKYMAEEANNMGVADAIVIDSKAQKILANFYILIQNPKIPTKFFRVEEEAIEWLRTYVDDQNPYLRDTD